MFNIDWNETLSHLVAAAVPFLTILTLKFLLDFRLATFLVSLLSWLPVRSIFRENPPKLKGDWEHKWDAGGSTVFSAAESTHGHPLLYQLGSYCRGTFFSMGREYAFFGQVNKGYWVGDWYDTKDANGYFGVFELEIISSSKMIGLWMGHSKTEKKIRTGQSIWTRVGDTRH
jgi:hypothetical protein